MAYDQKMAYDQEMAIEQEIVPLFEDIPFPTRKHGQCPSGDKDTGHDCDEMVNSASEIFAASGEFSYDKISLPDMSSPRDHEAEELKDSINALEVKVSNLTIVNSRLLDRIRSLESQLFEKTHDLEFYQGCEKRAESLKRKVITRCSPN